MGVGPRYSCKGLLTKPDILPVPCSYIFSMMMIVVNNRKNVQTNLLLHRINTRHKNKLNRPTANLTCTQKGATYSCIRILNSLHSNILKVQNDKSSFKVTLQRYLITHAFYSLDNLFSHSNDISTII